MNRHPYSLFYYLPLALLILLLLLTGCGGPLPTSTSEEHTQLLPLQQTQGEGSSTSALSPLSTPTPTDDLDIDADVEFVSARLGQEGKWTFSVTVHHPDTGWEDYADGWDVVLPNGTAILLDPDDAFTRLLLHPHESEQPFTRSQSGIVIPDGITQVTVRAHDLIDGWGGKIIVVDLATSGGAGFEVIRD